MVSGGFLCLLSTPLFLSPCPRKDSLTPPLNLSCCRGIIAGSTVGGKNRAWCWHLGLKLPMCSWV